MNRWKNERKETSNYNRFNTKFDIYIVCGLTAHQFLAKQEAASAAIYQNGTLIKIISTDHEETFRIEDGEDWNEITVDKDGIHVSGASCPDKICMHTVWRGKGSLPIVCLPNHLVITAAPEEDTDDEFDVLTY